ncbi:hypothetical protein HPOKI112_01345 [Helicobacter pylori oki112]|nr:hypothetical protein HPOKI112_01345 [Helicobacter pylori oki112]
MPAYCCFEKKKKKKKNDKITKYPPFFSGFNFKI